MAKNKILDIEYWKAVFEMINDPMIDEDSKGLLLAEWEQCPDEIKAKIDPALEEGMEKFDNPPETSEHRKVQETDNSSSFNSKTQILHKMQGKPAVKKETEVSVEDPETSNAKLRMMKKTMQEKD